jgi:hypothetical protein
MEGRSLDDLPSSKEEAGVSLGGSGAHRHGEMTLLAYMTYEAAFWFPRT